jgi:hypothetical protein
LKSSVPNSENLLGSFSLFDIGIHPIPFNNVSVFIEGWSCAGRKPAIGSIESAQTTFDFTRLARS